MNSKMVEDFVRWFLRLNGYFSIESFIVHDPAQIWHRRVGQKTETDTIAVRMPYSKEVAGNLYMANYPPLVNGAERRFDVIIAEAKSGRDNTPNKVWVDYQVDAVKYIVQFVGLCKSEAEIAKVANILSKTYCYESEEFRFRYIVFSKEPNQYYAARSVTYISLREVVNFLVEVRGQSWIESKIGVASLHEQWNQSIKEILAIANDPNLETRTRPERAYEKFLELAHE